MGRLSYAVATKSYPKQVEAIEGPLVPLCPPVGVFPAFAVHRQETTFVLEESTYSLSAADFCIKDLFGNVIFQVEGKAFSLRGVREIRDGCGQHLFTLRQPFFSLSGTFNAVASYDDDLVLFSTRQQWALGGTRLDVMFKNRVGAGGEMLLKLKGNFFDRDAVITLNDMPVARISRQIDFADVVFNVQTYFLTVSAGLDAALAVGICLCMDQARGDKNANRW